MNPPPHGTVCGWYTLAPNRPGTSDVSFHCVHQGFQKSPDTRMLFRHRPRFLEASHSLSCLRLDGCASSTFNMTEFYNYSF